MNKLLILFFAFLLASCSYKHDVYRVGQVWNYDTRAHEQGSTLTVVKVQKNKEFGVIVNVSVEGLKIEHDIVGTLDKIHHIALAESVMDSIVTNLIRTTKELPEYKKSYKEWKTQFKNGECTISNRTVKELIVVVEKIFEDNKQNSDNKANSSD